MKWFKKQNDSDDVHRLMGRILNRSFTSGLLMETDLELEVRKETRSNVISMPVVVANDDPSGEPCIKSGITQDASCEGLAILSQGPIPYGDVIVGFGPSDDWSVLNCTCLWSASVGYGYFQSGMHINKVLSPFDYEPIKQYAAALERGTGCRRRLAEVRLHNWLVCLAAYPGRLLETAMAHPE